MSGISINVVTKRTVMLHTIPLTARKQDEIRSLLCGYAKAKDGFLTAPSTATMWRYLDDKRGFRNTMKTAGRYPQGVNAHLLDQAAFDAVDTMVRHVESTTAGADVRANTGRRYQSEELEHRFAYTCVKRYEWIADVLCGRTVAVECFLVARSQSFPLRSFGSRLTRLAFPCGRVLRSLLWQRVVPPSEPGSVPPI